MAERSIGTGSYGGRASEEATAGRGNMGNMSGQMGEVTDRVKDKIDSARQPIADKLHGAADTIREQGSRLPGGEAISGAAQGAADKLESSATYIESHDARQMMRDLLGVVKRYPTQSLLLAGVVGFLVARAFRND